MVLCVPQKFIQNVHLTQLRIFDYVTYLQLLRVHFDEFLSWAESQSLLRFRVLEIHFSKRTVPRISRIFWPHLLNRLQNNTYTLFGCIQRWRLSQAWFFAQKIFLLQFSITKIDYQHALKVHQENTNFIWKVLILWIFELLKMSFKSVHKCWLDQMIHIKTIRNYYDHQYWGDFFL